MYQAVNNNYFWKLWSEGGIEGRKRFSLDFIYFQKVVEEQVTF